MLFRKNNKKLMGFMTPMLTLYGLTSHAQTDSVETKTLEPIVVIAEETNLEETPTVTVDGDQKILRDGMSLADVLEGLPGFSSTYFGPTASRPIVRGLGGDHVKVLQNGMNTLDASTLSYDHAIPFDPISVDEIEVLRGPAALQYGSNTIGGVINTIDQRIPTTPSDGVHGEVDTSYGTGDNGRKVAAKLQASNEIFGLHVDMFSRRNNDLRIPGDAWSARQKEGKGSYTIPNHSHSHDHDQDEALSESPHGRLPNSSARSDGGAIGGSWFWDNGYVGLSYNRYDSNYGSVAEQDVRLKMGQDQWKAAAQIDHISDTITSLKFGVSYTDYEHQEIADNVAVTEFQNKGYEVKMEAKHQNIGPFEGIWGVAFGNSRFSVEGDEAFVPKSHHRQWALFAIEEAPLSEQWKWIGGVRVEGHRLRPEDQGAGRFTPAKDRQFTTFSGSMGAKYQWHPHWSSTLNASYTERAPTFYELYSDGEHVATATFEKGNDGLNKEKSFGLDWDMTYQVGHHKARLGLFYNRFQNFIALSPSGNYCHAHGDHSHCSTDASDGGFAEFLYEGVPATFYGVEADSRFRVWSGEGSHLDMSVSGDYIYTKNRRTHEPLPRISPLRLGWGLLYGRGPWEADVHVNHAARQHRVPSNDVATDGYTTVGVRVNYRYYTTHTRWLFYVRGENLTNEEVRYPTSIVRDIAPLGGRSLILGVNVLF